MRNNEQTRGLLPVRCLAQLDGELSAVLVELWPWSVLVCPGLSWSFLTQEL